MIINTLAEKFEGRRHDNERNIPRDDLHLNYVEKRIKQEEITSMVILLSAKQEI